MPRFNTSPRERKIHNVLVPRAQKSNPEQKVLCYMKALFTYDPKEDSLHPCPEIGLMFFQGDILAIVNQANIFPSTEHRNLYSIFSAIC